MNTWTVGKDLIKHYCLVKEIFIVASTWKKLQMLIRSMQKSMERFQNTKSR